LSHEHDAPSHAGHSQTSQPHAPDEFASDFGPFVRQQVGRAESASDIVQPQSRHSHAVQPQAPPSPSGKRHSVQPQSGLLSPTGLFPPPVAQA
jgi:hypothetical protein